MDATGKQVARKFEAFENEADASRVHEALELIEAAERTAGSADERDLALRRRLQFFAALDRSIDPAWDPQKLPVKGAAPPEHHGAVHGSGEVDPATIADPAARAAYERALEASRAYANWYDIQFELRRIDERALRFVERLLAERYAGAPADRAAFEHLLADSSLTEARKQQLRALM